MEQQGGQRQATALAAAEHAGALVHGVATEQERAEEVADLGNQIERCGGGDHVEHRLVRIETGAAVLGEIAERDIVPQPAFAGVRGLDAGEQSHQGGLPGAVRPDERDLAAAFEEQVEPVVDREIVVAFARAAELQHGAAAAWRLRKAEMHRAHAVGRHQALDLVELLDAALHQRRL